MDLKEILREYDLTLDDVRWYLAALLAQRLTEYKEKIPELTKYIWSGELEDELYNMEEEYIAHLQSKLNSAHYDEHRIREILREIVWEREKRIKS